MSQYYLMAQLPSLDAVNETTPLPITEVRFQELCGRFLGKKTLKAMDEMTLIPPKDGSLATSSFINEWNRAERLLRLALGSVRANKLKKPFDAGAEILPAQMVQAAKTAVEMDDPMAAERFLNRVRLEFLETLRPMDAFCDDAVLYYGLKLKLLQRIQQFDENRGRETYRTIYDSIMRGEEREAEQ